MGVYMLTKLHIDALANAAVQFGLLDSESTQDIEAFGQTLWSENHRCVTVQWGDEHVPDAPTYSFTRAETRFHPLAVLRLITGYTYQSDETPDWETSRAQQLCQQLRAAVEATLPAEQTRLIPFHGNPIPVYQLQPDYNTAPFAVSNLAHVPTITDPPPRTALFEVGDPVELVHTDDEHTQLKPGDHGIIAHIDAVGTVHVQWENGSCLGMIPGKDRIRHAAPRTTLSPSQQ